MFGNESCKKCLEVLIGTLALTALRTLSEPPMATAVSLRRQPHETTNGHIWQGQRNFKFAWLCDAMRC